MKKLIVVFGLCLMVSNASGSGFSIYEFGGRASAMAGAAVARPWDASTIFYNPAGLAFLRGTQFYGGTTLIFPAGKFIGAAPLFDATVYKSKSAIYTPIGLYFSHKLSDRLGVGLGVTNPFGLGVKWYDDFPGRGISKDAQLQSFYISPVFGYKISDRFSIGGGPDIVFSSVKLVRHVYLFESEGSPGYEVGVASLEGNSKLTLGFSAAAMYRSDRFGFGVLYRHSVTNEYNQGEVTFTIFDDLTVPNIAAVARKLLVNQNVRTAITFPNILSVGAYYRLLERFGIEVDYLWFNWSVFDAIELEFDDARLNQTVPEDYRDSWQLRVGAHYEVNDRLSLRAGYIYDRTPQPVESVSPLLPDATRHDFSFGVGYRFDKYQIDLGYMLVAFDERSTVVDGEGKNHYRFDGTYTSRADLVFASFGIQF